MNFNQNVQPIQPARPVQPAQPQQILLVGMEQQLRAQQQQLQLQQAQVDQQLRQLQQMQGQQPPRQMPMVMMQHPRAPLQLMRMPAQPNLALPAPRMNQPLALPAPAPLPNPPQKQFKQPELPVFFPSPKKASENPVDSKTLFILRQEFLKACETSPFQFSDESLTLIGPYLTSLKENPLHILLEKGEAQEVLAKLVKACPQLLRIANKEDKTPVDILFEKNEFETIRVFLGAAYPAETHRRFACISTFCHAKNAEALINKLPPYPGALDLQGIPEEDYPGFVCQQLDKNFLMKSILSKFPKGSDFEKAVMLGNATLAEEAITRDKMDFYAVAYALHPMTKMGGNPNFVKNIITEHAKSIQSTAPFAIKELAATLDFAPLLLEDNFLERSDLLLVFRECMGRFSEWALKVVEKLIDNKLLSKSDCNKKLAFFITRNTSIGEKIVKEYERLGAKESLFDDICRWTVTRSMIERLIPLLQREGIPIQLASDSPLLHSVLYQKDAEPFFELIETLIPRDKIIELLQKENAKKITPMDIFALTATPTLSLLKKLMGYVTLEAFKTVAGLKSAVLGALSSGDAELEVKFPLNALDARLSRGWTPVETLFRVKMGAKSFLKKLPLFSERVKAFLMPQDKPFPFDETTIIKDILENSDIELMKLFPASFNPETVIHFLPLATKKIDLELLRQMLAAPYPIKSLPQNFAKLDPDVLECLFDVALNRLYLLNSFNDAYKAYAKAKIPDQYNGWTITFDGTSTFKIIGPGFFYDIPTGQYPTRKTIESKIDQLKDQERIKLLKNTRSLKSAELKAYTDLVLDASATAETKLNCSVYILNNIKDSKFIVHYVDFDTGNDHNQDFPYSSETVIQEMTDFVDERLRHYDERKNLLVTSFLEYTIELIHSGRKTNVIGLKEFEGIPTLETLKFYKDLQDNGFSIVNIESDSLVEAVESFESPTYAEFTKNNQKLFILKRNDHLILTEDPKALWTIFSVTEGYKLNKVAFYKSLELMKKYTDDTGQLYEGFCLPLLIQEKSQDPIENLTDLLMDSFEENFKLIDDKYWFTICDNNSELADLNKKLNEYLVHPAYIADKQRQSELDAIPKQLNELMNEKAELEKGLKEHEEGGAHTHKKRRFIDGGSNTLVEKEFLELEIAEKEEKIQELLATRERLTASRDHYISGVVSKLHKTIKTLEAEIATSQEIVDREKKELVLNYCVQKGWIENGRLTDRGIIKILILSGLLVEDEVMQVI